MLLVLTFNIAAVIASLAIGFATGWWIWKNRRHETGSSEDSPTS